MIEIGRGYITEITESEITIRLDSLNSFCIKEAIFPREYFEEYENFVQLGALVSYSTSPTTFPKFKFHFYTEEDIETARKKAKEWMEKLLP